MIILKSYLVLCLLAILPSGESDAGVPLILTPWIKSGQIKEAQNLSKVTNFTNIVSYSGYLTVNEIYNSNMFFWFIPAQNNSTTSPVLLWLQGGPGSSSLFGLFVENGPFKLNANYEIEFRPTSWTMTHNVLYIDNPVGSGFSFTDNPAGYSRNEEDIAKNLYNALTQFFTLFPEYQKQPFFATGESYAGKYVPALSSKIHKENRGSPKIKINLKGMVIGDGFCDPINQVNYADYLYQVGLLDWPQKLHFDVEQYKIRGFTQMQQFPEAFQTWDALLGGLLTPYPTYLENITGLNFIYNFMYQSMPDDMVYYNDFLEQDSVRRSIHVGNTTFNNASTTVLSYLANDIFQSVSPLIADLLNAKENYTLLMYSGQLDFVVPNTQTVSVIENLRWHGKLGWDTAEKQIWRVNGTVAGFSKIYDNLMYLLVRNSGHMVPYDHPEWAFDMINRFTAGKPFA